MYTYIHVVCVSVCIHIYVCIHNTCGMCACMYIYIYMLYVCLCVYISMVYVCLCVYISSACCCGWYVCVCLCVSMCIRVYCIHTHTYVRNHISSPTSNRYHVAKHHMQFASQLATQLSQFLKSQRFIGNSHSKFNEV